MRQLVVDASVAVKWFVPEIHSEAAARWLSSGWPMLAPDLLFAEAGNIAWKKVLRGELTENEARRLNRALRRVPLRIVSARVLSAAALELALAIRCTVYDALYVALAVAENALLVSADGKLHGALSKTRLAGQVAWVEDRPPAD